MVDAWSVVSSSLTQSSVTVSLASLMMRRRATGVTIVPSRIRCVDAAIAASASHGSEISPGLGKGTEHMVPDEEPVPTVLLSCPPDFDHRRRIRQGAEQRKIDGVPH